jgi:hypothetical protein
VRSWSRFDLVLAGLRAIGPTAVMQHTPSSGDLVGDALVGRLHPGLIEEIPDLV